MDEAIGRSEKAWFAAAGAVMLGLAALFGWRELGLAAPYGLIPVSLAGAVLALLGTPKAAPHAGFAVLALSAATGGVWYVLQHSAELLPGIGVTALAAVVAALGSYPRARRAGDTVVMQAIAFGAVGACLVGSWVFYFHYLTAGFASDLVTRRLVLTVVWLVGGVVLVVLGRRRREAAVSLAGLIPVGAAVVKALAYDTTHLAGPARICTLAFSGAVLLLAASLLPRRDAEET